MKRQIFKSFLYSYDELSERFVDYQKISLKDIEKIELAPESGSSQFGKLTRNSPRFHVIRLHYKVSFNLADSNLLTDETGYFHTFRSCNLRFFNNLVITTKSNDELTEALRGICHTIQSTATYFNTHINFEEANKLQK